MSASADGPARASRCRIGWPSHFALLIRLPPTSLETQVSVVTDSSSGRASSWAKVSSTSFSTMPVIRRRQADGSMPGICSAVSMR
ncbi:hypothetical protein ABH923_003776 [Leifsonia sp. EB41]